MRPQPTAPAMQSVSSSARIVVGDALREKRALPLDGGGFEALELAQGIEDALFAGELGLRREVLPAEKPVHVLRWGDRLDLFAERVDGALVDALEKASFAPLNLPFWQIAADGALCWARSLWSLASGVVGDSAADCRSFASLSLTSASKSPRRNRALRFHRYQRTENGLRIYPEVCGE